MAFDLRNALTQRAQAVIPGAAYNAYRQARSERGESGTYYYEAALPAEAPWRALAEEIMPAFVRYLQAKSIDPERPAGVVVPLFFQDRCYILSGDDLISLFCELEGLNRAAFHFRALRWLVAPST
jgi:hypothetical protein